MRFKGYAITVFGEQTSIEKIRNASFAQNFTIFFFKTNRFATFVNFALRKDLHSRRDYSTVII